MAKAAPPNCYDCAFRRDVPGSAHSRCAVLAEMPKGHELNAMLVFMGNGRYGDGVVSVEGHPHGIRSGWCMWPNDFDPVWIRSCNSFKAKEPRGG